MNDEITFEEEQKKVIELYFSCRSLKKGIFNRSLNPMLVLSTLSLKGLMLEREKTEVVFKQNDPDFTKSFVIDYVFEKKKKFKVEVFHFDQNKEKNLLVGECEFELENLMISLGNIKILNLTKNGIVSGKCIIFRENVSLKNNSKIDLEFEISHLKKFFLGSQTYLKIYKLFINTKNNLDFNKLDEREKNRWVLVMNSNPSRGDLFHLNAKSITSSKFFNNNPVLPLKIELWKINKLGKDILIGEKQTNWQELTNNINLRTPFVKNNKQSKAEFCLKKIQKEKIFRFVDFLKSGVNISLMFGIDFSISNGENYLENSLHVLNPKILNPYQKSILAIGKVLKNYDKNEKLYAFGFGAKLKNKNISHFFPVNMDKKKPWVSTFEELNQKYEVCCKSLTFSGPSFFAPICQKVLNFTKKSVSHNIFNYTIFLILTDGIINDFQSTVDVIIKACYYPISIIIVGVGKGDFRKMEKLDADNEELVSSHGQKMIRDIVQFIPIEKYENDFDLIREEVMREIPKQVTEFYQLNNIKPLNFNLD